MVNEHGAEVVTAHEGHMGKKKRNPVSQDHTDDTQIALGGALNGALGRLRKSAAEIPEADSELKGNAFANESDPTHAAFLDGGSDAGGGISLNIMLEDSATAIVQREEELNRGANRLISRIAERVSGEITLRVQGLRVLIGLAWLSIAAWLYISALNAQAAGQTTLANGMSVDDAYVLMRVFLIVAGAGLAVAYGIAALVHGFGRGNNRKVREEGEALGAAIAGDALEFDRMLTDLRGEMDRRAAAGDAVTDLSRAHMTALEACAYFRRMPFLNTEDRNQAETQFRDFLHRRPIGFSIPDMLAAAALGATIGAFYIWFAYVPRPEPVEPVTPLAIMQYPWAVAALLLGGLAYASVGLAFAIIGGLIAGNTAPKARAEALEALRSAFTTREAPRPADVIRRINDAIDVFKARVSARQHGGLQDSNQTPADDADFSGDEADSPAWRRRDSSVKFVETGFQASPARWRTNPEENFSESAPDAKRSFFKLKNPFRH